MKIGIRIRFYSKSDLIVFEDSDPVNPNLDPDLFFSVIRFQQRYLKVFLDFRVLQIQSHWRDSCPESDPYISLISRYPASKFP